MNKLTTKDLDECTKNPIKEECLWVRNKSGLITGKSKQTLFLVLNEQSSTHSKQIKHFLVKSSTTPTPWLINICEDCANAYKKFFTHLEMIELSTKDIFYLNINAK